jgi:hypothetical protein
VVLSFDAGEDDKAAVLLPGHSQILSAWSSVLAGAVEAALTSTSARHSGSCKEAPCAAAAAAAAAVGQPDAAAAHDCTREGEAAVTAIPMPGTSLQEWLEVAAFMYPVIPPAQVRARIAPPVFSSDCLTVSAQLPCIWCASQPFEHCTLQPSPASSAVVHLLTAAPAWVTAADA